MMRQKKKTMHRNKASAAEFEDSDLLNPFAEGGFKFAANGVYTEGYRKGTKAVCKWFKTGHVNEELYFDQDIRAMEKSVELVALWNEKSFIEQKIRVNIPEVWTFVQSEMFPKETKVLVEPFIENYKKFNSNTGWATNCSTPWPMVMQALSHFTYHASSGKYLLCDVQGGVYTKAVVLTDPAVHSRAAEFGETDLGSKGISTFFSEHRCNKYCHPNWLKPKDRAQYYQPQEGTSMSSDLGSATMAPPPPRIPGLNSKAQKIFDSSATLQLPPLKRQRGLFSRSVFNPPGTNNLMLPPPRRPAFNRDKKGA